MSRWFRLHDELVDDPKVQCLPDALFKALINLWCITSQNDGSLPSIDAIAFKLRMKPQKVGAVMRDLRTAGLIVDDDDGVRPHNWDGRQYKSDVTDPTAPERMKRYRKNRNAVTSNTVTQTVTVTPTRAETEQKDAAPNGARDMESDEADLFKRGKKILGPDSGGLIAKLLKAKKGSVPLTRAAIEQASTKENPREYIGAICRGPPDQRHGAQNPLAGII